MKELHHEKGAFSVDDRVAEALERLAVALAESRMSAVVKLHPPGKTEWVEFTLGMDITKGRTRPLRARPSDEGSRLGMDEF